MRRNAALLAAYTPVNQGKAFHPKQLTPVMKIDPPIAKTAATPFLNRKQRAAAYSGRRVAFEMLLGNFRPSATGFGRCRRLRVQDGRSLSFSRLTVVETGGSRVVEDWPAVAAHAGSRFRPNQLDGPRRGACCPSGPVMKNIGGPSSTKTAWRSPQRHAARSTRDDRKTLPSSFPIISPVVSCRDSICPRETST